MTPKELRDIRRKLRMSTAEFSEALWPLAKRDTAKRRLRRIEAGRADVPSPTALAAQALVPVVLRSAR